MQYSTVQYRVTYLRVCVNHLTDEGVVKKGNIDPRYSLIMVLCLLLLQDHLDKQLLQLLVAVVDAELLKPIHTKHFESVDIKDTKDCLDGMGLGIHDHRCVDTLHN